MNITTDKNDLTYGIEVKILSGLVQSLKKNDEDSFSILRSFIPKVLNISIENNSIHHFIQYTILPASIYAQSYIIRSKNNELDSFCKEAEKKCIDILLALRFPLKHLFEKSVTPKEILDFHYYTYYGYSKIFYSLLKNEDIPQLKYTLNNYNLFQYEINSYKIQRELKDNIDINSNSKQILQYRCNKYKYHTIKGIKYWLLFLYQSKAKSLNFTKEVIDLLKDVKYDEHENPIADIIFLRNPNINFYYLDWNHWDFKDRENLVVYSPPNTTQWLTFGFVVDQIKQFNLTPYNLTEEESSSISHLYQDVINDLKYLEENFNDWKEILELNHLEDFIFNKNKIINFFKQIEDNKSIQQVRTIANTPLNNAKVLKLRKNTGDMWHRHRNITNIFKEFNATEIINDNNTYLNRIGGRILYDKKIFIDGDYPPYFGLDQLGGEIAREEDSYFLQTIFLSSNKTIFENNIQNLILILIEKLNATETVPDCIFVPYSYRHSDELRLSEYFVALDYNNTDYQRKHQFLGTFKGIKVFTSFSPILGNNVIVSSFKKAFLMRYKTNKEWFEDELKYEVREISSEEAEEILTKSPEKWKTSDSGAELGQDDSLKLIKNRVILDCWTILDFQIINRDCFKIGTIKHD